MRELKLSDRVRQKLLVRLISELVHLGKKYQTQGIRIFIFGSAVQENDRQESDLDLGVIWDTERSERIFNSLYWDIQDLPTVRKIDLVDMEQVDPVFRESALRDALFLDEL